MYIVRTDQNLFGSCQLFSILYILWWQHVQPLIGRPVVKVISCWHIVTLCKTSLIDNYRPALLWSRHAITERRNSNWYLGYYTYVEYSPRWVVLILVLVPRTVEFLTVFGCHSLHLTNFGQKLSVWTSDPIKDGIWILAERVPLRWLRNKEMCV